MTAPDLGRASDGHARRYVVAVKWVAALATLVFGLMALGGEAHGNGARATVSLAFFLVAVYAERRMR